MTMAIEARYDDGDGRDGSGGALGTAMRDLVQRAIGDGIGPLTGSVAYAEDRLARHGDRERAIRRIINESAATAGTTGFLTAVGGVVALPVTLPANVVGNLVINARMVGAIAHLRGYDLADPNTQTILLLVVAGTSAQKAMSMLGVKIGTEWTKQVIKQIPRSVIRQINRRAGFHLVAKYGTKRATVTLVKAVPIVGGLVGGGIDASLTKIIGHQSLKAFPASAHAADQPVEQWARAA